jgi:hypothetical protein
MKESNTFPWKLHEMLDSVEYDRIVSWLPDGVSFKVHNPATFVREVLPKFFLQTKYKSFQRQLNIWGFERISIGPNKGGYMRTELFIRGKAPLVNAMKRRKKSHSKKPAASFVIESDSDVTNNSKMFECTSSSICDEVLESSAFSSNVSVSVDGDDHYRQLQQHGAMEDPANSGSDEDEDIFPLPLDYSKAFSIPDVADNDCGDHFLFEGEDFFLDDDDEDDPLTRPLHHDQDGKYEEPKDDPFSPTPITSRSIRMEKMSDLDLFIAGKRMQTNMWLETIDNLAAGSDEKPTYSGQIKSWPSCDEDTTCQKRVAECQKITQLRNSSLTFSTKESFLRPPSSRLIHAFDMDIRYPDDQSHRLRREQDCM